MLLSLGQLVIGGIATGVGPIFLYWGSVLAARADSATVEQRLAEFGAKLDEAKRESSVDPVTERSSDRISKVDEEFSSWADDFVKQRHLRRLDFARAKLDAQSVAAEVTARWSPFMEKVLNLSRNILTAYNEKSGSEIKMDLPEIPPDLFASPYNGKITFHTGAVWTLSTNCFLPARDSSGAALVIGFGNSEVRSGSIIQIQFYARSKTFEIGAFGEAVPADIGTKQLPLTEFDAVISTSVRRLVEAQLLNDR